MQEKKNEQFCSYCKTEIDFLMLDARELICLFMGCYMGKGCARYIAVAGGDKECDHFSL